MRPINDDTMALIKHFEGFRSKAYIDPVGILTIGYGTTSRAGIGVTVKSGMTITEAQAEHYLKIALEKFAESISPAITTEINENEYGAFLSLAYNIGPGGFKRSSALRKFNAGDKLGAANAILLWNKGTVSGKKVVLNGLKRRREAERELFLSDVVEEEHPPHSGLSAFLNALFKAIFGGKKQ